MWRSAVQEVKAGKVEFRTDKTALVHCPVGKISFTPDKLIDNATTLISSVIKAKPSVAKGKYIKGCYSEFAHGAGHLAGYDSDRDGGEGVRPSFVLGRQSFGGPCRPATIRTTSDQRATTFLKGFEYGGYQSEKN